MSRGLLLEEKLLSGTREALCIAGSPVHSQLLTPGGSSTGMGPRRGSISSLSSVTSMLEEKDDEKIRCCHHCMDKLLKRQQKLEEKDVKRVGTPHKGSHILPAVDEKAPEWRNLSSKPLSYIYYLEENLHQLQDEYDQQQTSLAIALSQKMAEEEGKREVNEHWGGATIKSSVSWEQSLRSSPVENLQLEKDDEENLTPRPERPTHVRAFLVLEHQEESPPRLRSLGGHVTPPGDEGQNGNSLNPFDEEDSTPVEEDSSNPFLEDIRREHEDTTNGKKEYNPPLEGDTDSAEGQCTFSNSAKAKESSRL